MPLMAMTAEQKLCNKAKRKVDQLSSLARTSGGRAGSGSATVAGAASWLSGAGLVWASLMHIKLADFQKLRRRGGVRESAGRWRGAARAFGERSGRG
jgi:hypothetical protein